MPGRSKLGRDAMRGRASVAEGRASGVPGLSRACCSARNAVPDGRRVTSIGLGLGSRRPPASRAPRRAAVRGVLLALARDPPRAQCRVVPRDPLPLPEGRPPRSDRANPRRAGRVRAWKAFEARAQAPQGLGFALQWLHGYRWGMSGAAPSWVAAVRYSVLVCPPRWRSAALAGQGRWRCGLRPPWMRQLSLRSPHGRGAGGDDGGKKPDCDCLRQVRLQHAARRGYTPAAAVSKATNAAKQCHQFRPKATLKSAPRSDKMKVLALAGLAASASALLAPAAMPRALVARPAPTADATVLEVPRPRPLF